MSDPLTCPTGLTRSIVKRKRQLQQLLVTFYLRGGLCIIFVRVATSSLSRKNELILVTRSMPMNGNSALKSLWHIVRDHREAYAENQIKLARRNCHP